ncbi:unnamed protein product [Diamesa serratosioi]
MLNWCKVLLLILILDYGVAKQSTKTDFLLEKFEVGGEEGVVDFSKLRSIKVNRTTYAVNGSVKILQDIGNDVLVKVELWEQQGGEYRKTQFRLAEKAWCDFSKTETMYLPALWETSNFPPLQDCPLPKGEYYIKNFVPDPEKLPEFLDGRYMIRVFTDRVDAKSEIYFNYFIEIKRYPS